MVCTADDLLGWKDFPKGLRVLLLDEDSNSAEQMRSKLEGMDYVVSIFCNEEEALSAISSRCEAFHVAIVEVSAKNNDGIFKILETAKDLPTIMTSNINCLSTMMKCIALGAVEFLQKPLSEDKLRNIWQHVVHKAFNAGGKDIPKSLKPVKESVVSMLQLQLEEGETERQIPAEIIPMLENNQETSSCSDKYPAPSTPQLKQGVRTVDHADCPDQTNLSIEQESGEQEWESKSVETTCCNLVADSTAPTEAPQAVVKEENESAGFCRIESKVSPSSLNNDSADSIKSDDDDPIKSSDKASGLQNPCGNKGNRKKIKVDWTPELHKKFVQAVEQLGVDQAIPSRILELMKVEGLTRHNVASHLQKYRMHRRQILPKEDDRRWPHPKDSIQRSYYPHKPVMAFPPYHSNHSLPPGQVYPAWVPPAGYPNSVQMWGSPYYPGWQPTESWHWKPFHGMQADAWGCPVMPSLPGVYPPFPQNAAGTYRTNEIHSRYSTLEKSFDIHPAEEVIDKIVKEAINKPWLPLPLGLKSPSTEVVLNELSRQGISTIPPGSHSR